MAAVAVSQAPVARQEEATDPYALRFLDLSESVFVAQRPNPVRSPVEGNSLVVIADHGVVVFDAGGVPRTARQTLGEIRRRTQAGVRMVVNSHAHLDHTGGNSLYRDAFPSLVIVGGRGTRDYMTGAFGDRFAYVREIAADPSDRQRRGEEQIAELERAGDERSVAIAERSKRYFRHDILRESEAFREVVIEPPDVTLEGELVLSGEPLIRIAHIGYGKSPGDLILELPEQAIVATGDILTHPIPLGFSRSSVSWLETLRALRALDADLYVPGHGELLEGTDYLDRVIALVGDLVAQIRASVAAGLDRDETLSTLDLSAHRARFTAGSHELDDLFDSWFLEPAGTRAFDEISGR